MKTKILIPMLACFAISLSAQDVPAKLNEARTSYQGDDLENTRFILQEALNGINQEIGRKILEMLPADMNGMPHNQDSDDVVGMNVGFAGLFVSRDYVGENSAASIEIMSDAPMLAGINAILAMPGFMTSDPNQKRIKIDNYKALMTKNEDDEGRITYDIQLPFGNSLLTFQCKGINAENEVIGMANRLPVSDIVAITR